MPFRALAVLLALMLAAAGPGRASTPSGRAGGRAAGGSHGYWRVGAFGGVDWSGPDFSPFLSAEALEDKYSRELEFLGGTWKTLGPNLQGRAALGFAFGRVKDADEPSQAGILELGLEREIERGGVGGGYRLVSGSIGGGTSPTARRRLAERAQGRGGHGTAIEPERYSYHEISGYGWVPLGDGPSSGSARLALGLPSYAGPVWTGTLGLSLPLHDPSWTLSPSVSVERGSSSGVYGGLALSRRF